MEEEPPKHMSESPPIVKANESQRQQCLQHLQGLSQQLRELRNQPGSPPQEVQPLGMNSTQPPGAQSQGGSIKASPTDAEFAETVALSLSESLKNGSLFTVPGAVDLDDYLTPRLGPGTFIGCLTRGNFGEFEKAWLRAAKESETGEVRLIIAHMSNQGFNKRIVDTSRILKVEDSNLLMPAEDVTSASDEEARNAAAENEQN